MGCKLGQFDDVTGPLGPDHITVILFGYSVHVCLKGLPETVVIFLDLAWHVQRQGTFCPNQ